jgi:predicted Zn-dependent protease
MRACTTGPRVRGRGGTPNALPLAVLATSFIRRELRGRRMQIGQAAQLVHGLLRKDSPAVRAHAISFGLELAQLDPEEPHVRALSEDVYTSDEDVEHGVGDPALACGDAFASMGDELLYARTLLGTGRSRPAERLLAGLLAVDPENPVGQTLLLRAKQMQGKLRDAVRVWENLSRAGNEPSALATLRSIYQSSLQPDGGTEPSLGPSDPRAARYHIAQAFRLAAAGKPEAGAAICDVMMEQHRTGDRALYKLAVFAKVWLLEAQGLLDQAVLLVEALGVEQDLADDVDRQLSLVRLLDMQPGKASRAVEIYQRLFDQFRDPAILARMARLCVKLGDLGRAKALGRRHLAAFEQDLGYASLPQLLRAASRRHVAVRDLESFSFTPESLAEEWRRLSPKPGREARRKLALVAILLRDFKGAEEVLGGIVREQREHPIDLAYLGELASIDGRPEHATAWYVSSLECRRARGEAPDGLALAGFMVASELSSPADPLKRSAIAEFSNGWDVQSAIAELARTRPSDPLVWRALARVSRLRGCEEEGARHQGRAEFLERRGSPPNLPGHALAVAAYHAHGDRKGMVHELWVARRRSSGQDAGLLVDDNIFANVTDDFRIYLRGLFDSMKHYARARFAHVTEDIDRYTYEFKLTNEDERSSGPSAGLAIAMAFVSLFLGRPLPGDTAYSGVVVTEARDGLSLRRVGDADVKVEGALARRVRRFVLPLDSRSEVEQSDVVPPEASMRVVVYARDLDEALEAVFGDDVWLW